MPVSSPRHANHPALVALGDAIRRVRLERGVSQEELAHQSEIDRSYMSSIERGQQNPGIVSILRIAQALDTTLTELAAEARL
ncbi:MAG: XRE family transcriptional regulator [Aquabacterium sp.]|nr:MAG: XRE family transcriptional regulator [Aquabacterium sp.]